MQIRRFEPFGDFDRAFSALWSQTSSAVPIDAVRRENDVVVHVDLPGVDQASIDLTIEGRQLTLRAERSFALAEGDELITNERRHGSVTRVLHLSEKLDPARVEADYRDGVLTLVIPYSETAKPRKVAVGAGGREPEAIDTTAQDTTAQDV
jgi:HSP20 family protein